MMLVSIAKIMKYLLKLLSSLIKKGDIDQN